MSNKLKSRKFWAMIVGVILGVATCFGLDAGTIEKVAGLVAALASAVTYMVVEGNIDAAAAKTVMVIDNAEEAD